MLVVAEEFSGDALGSIPLHRPTNAPRGCNTQATTPHFIVRGEQRQERAPDLSTALIDVLEFWASPDALVLPEALI